MGPYKTITFVLLMMTLWLAACSPSENAEPTAPSDESTAPVMEKPTEEPKVTEEPTEEFTCAEPIKVGLITDVTGPLAIYGAHILPSFMLGMEYVTGEAGSAGDVFDFAVTQENTFMLDDCEIRVFVRDDASAPDNIKTVALELIEVEGVDVLVGTVSSGLTATLQSIAAESQIPLIVAPADANDITGINFNEYTFRTSRNYYQDAMNECQYLTKEQNTFVQISPDYAFGKDSAAAFRDACTFSGGEFVADDIFAPLDTSDFTLYMEQVRNSGADAYIVTWVGGGFVPLMQDATELGVVETMELGITFIDNTLMRVWYDKMVGSIAGILYHWSAPDNAINNFLVSEHKARYGTMPDLFAGDGMNAAIMLVEGLKVTNGDSSGKALITAFEGMSFEGPKGTVFIRPEDHVAIQDMFILKLVDLTAPDADFYEYVDTTRPKPPCLLPENLKDRCGDLPYGSLRGE